MPDYTPPHGPIEILHRDEALLLVAKPAGLLTVPGKATALADCLLSRLEEQDARVRLVHRLDRDTSGVMVFARSREAQRHLGLQFERRHLSKRYEARVAGDLWPEEGCVDLPLKADWPNRPRQMVHPEGRTARTFWNVVGRSPGETRVSLRPETGRSHQIRVHLLALGHPILGDTLYAEETVDAHPRMMLHATALDLRHPNGGARIGFVSPCPF
ncbi:ribosomal large subunit pseudouridine synthase A [Palleronia aestuarii]|uniref:Pseudouridine synthase n=1 Tax=Palleronia aestuarii TaxID=568105 RepID=A0A2W7NF47_9RHOB|nr:RluA family pseudouridine synthase [Palleronia aestuarii]PZX18828.1 ribosomal large subunit pseudouridine synthase A [Palleronia aestuarii]